jgi:hypothetical protein
MLQIWTKVTIFLRQSRSNLILEPGTEDNCIHDVLKIFDKLPVYPDELIHWTEAIETAAKNMSKNKTDGIRFRYDIDEKDMKFFLKDSNSRDCLVKSIEIHLPSIPESLQGFFSVLKYNLRNLKFN